MQKIRRIGWGWDGDVSYRRTLEGNSVSQTLVKGASCR